MLQTGTIDFLTQLSENNNKPWFDEHRKEYEAAKQDFEVFVTSILNGLAEQEPLFKEQRAKDCIFRIFRDVRFSKDKSPYKSNFGAAFGKDGRKAASAGYYLHIEPGGKTFIGGGLWMPEAPLLKAVRQEIDYNFDAFKGIIEDKKFKKYFPKIDGEQLKTPPQGYDASNPAIDYLKLKSFVAGHKVDDADLASKGFPKKVLEIFATMKPFIDFLNHAMQ